MDRHLTLKLLIAMLMPIFIYSAELSLDVNADGYLDRLAYEVKDLQQYPGLNEPTISITIDTQKTHYSFDTFYATSPTLSSCGAGCISIKQVRGGISGLDLVEEYKFDQKRDYWFLYKSIENETRKYFNESLRIDYILQPKESLKEFLIKCRNKDKKLLNSITNFDYIDYYLKHDTLNTKTLTTYNNIAYYLQKAGANEEAIFLLEKILEKFPNRTVAYYNLGDAYWELGEKEKAVKAYLKYIEQMRGKGLEKTIPKHILEKVRGE